MSQQPISRVLAQDLFVRCLDPRGVFRDVAVTFAYDPEDPYAVWVTVPWLEDHLSWGVCRSLLSRGLTDPVGEGHVQLWPSTNDAGRGIVVMDLWSREHHVVAEVSTRELYRFLTRTLAAVPFGSERLHLDVDELIDGLLSQAE